MEHIEHINRIELQGHIGTVRINEHNGSKVTNVSNSGVLLTNFEGELTRLNEAFYEESSTAQVTNFTSNITVEKQ